MNCIKLFLLKLTCLEVCVRKYLEFKGYVVTWDGYNIIVNDRCINKERFVLHKDWHHYGIIGDIEKALYVARL